MSKSILVSDNILNSLINGTDACLVSYGHDKLNKHKTMFDSNGLVSTAIAYLFEIVNRLKVKSNSKFLVKLSALEIAGKEERFKDLLIASKSNFNLSIFEFFLTLICLIRKRKCQ